MVLEHGLTSLMEELKIAGKPYEIARQVPDQLCLTLPDLIKSLETLTNKTTRHRGGKHWKEIETANQEKEFRNAEREVEGRTVGEDSDIQGPTKGSMDIPVKDLSAGRSR